MTETREFQTDHGQSVRLEIGPSKRPGCTRIEVYVDGEKFGYAKTTFPGSNLYHLSGSLERALRWTFGVEEIDGVVSLIKEELGND